jgi:hypothetical protein
MVAHALVTVKVIVKPCCADLCAVRVGASILPVIVLFIVILLKAENTIY